MVQTVISVSPEQRGLKRSRWWLDGIRQAVSWLHHRSLTSVQNTLRRFKLVYKRGRRYTHSPDPDYDRKMAYIVALWERVRADPSRYVLLYEDEFSYYRRPSLGSVDKAMPNRGLMRPVHGKVGGVILGGGLPR
jgi:hypothetical protein